MAGLSGHDSVVFQNCQVANRAFDHQMAVNKLLLKTR